MADTQDSNGWKWKENGSYRDKELCDDNFDFNVTFLEKIMETVLWFKLNFKWICA